MEVMFSTKEKNLFFKQKTIKEYLTLAHSYVLFELLFLNKILYLEKYDSTPIVFVPPSLGNIFTLLLESMKGVLLHCSVSIIICHLVLNKHIKEDSLVHRTLQGLTGLVQSSIY